MDRGEVKDKEGMVFEPPLNLLARMNFKIVAYQVDRPNLLGNLRFYVLQK